MGSLSIRVLFLRYQIRNPAAGQGSVGEEFVFALFSQPLKESLDMRLSGGFIGAVGDEDH